MPYLKRRGMGDTWKYNSDSGKYVDCTVVGMFSPTCWNPFNSGAEYGAAADPNAAIAAMTPQQVAQNAANEAYLGNADSQIAASWFTNLSPFSNAPNSDPNAMPWGTIALVAVVAVLGFTALGSGGARRYGR